MRIKEYIKEKLKKPALVSCGKMYGFAKNQEEQFKTLIPFLAKLHKRFIHIHPFDDGNGRVVRLLLSYVLVRLDFLPMILNDRGEYIKAIEFSDTGDHAPLEKLFLDNIISSLQKGIFAKDNRIDWSKSEKAYSKSIEA